MNMKNQRDGRVSIVDEWEKDGRLIGMTLS